MLCGAVTCWARILYLCMLWLLNNGDEPLIWGGVPIGTYVLIGIPRDTPAPRRRLGYSATTDAKVSVLTFICFDATLSMGTIYYA